MGKRSRADSVRNANLVKAMIKKTKINNEKKENVSTHIMDKNSFSNDSEF